MNGRRRYIALALLIVVRPGLAVAEEGDPGAQQAVVAEGPVKLSVRVDRGVARVADPIQLVLEVEAPRGTRVELPNLSSQLGDFEIRSSEQFKDVPSGDNGEVRRWVLKAKLETIKASDRTIPPLEVHYSLDDKSTKRKSLSSKALPVRITSVLEGQADLRKFNDIKDAVDVAVPELPSRAWIAWSAIGAGVLFSSLALTVVVATRRRRGPTPAEWATAAIADLQKLPVANTADADAIYNEVVDVIREFFELEFGVRTLSRTTREFLTDAIDQVKLDEMPRKRLTWLARLADEIKFARRGIGAEQVHQALQQARTFVAECEQHRRTLSEEAA
jgi:hypothetical protein